MTLQFPNTLIVELPASRDELQSEQSDLNSRYVTIPCIPNTYLDLSLKPHPSPPTTSASTTLSPPRHQQPPLIQPRNNINIPLRIPRKSRTTTKLAPIILIQRLHTLLLTPLRRPTRRRTLTRLPLLLSTLFIAPRPRLTHNHKSERKRVPCHQQLPSRINSNVIDHEGEPDMLDQLYLHVLFIKRVEIDRGFRSRRHSHSRRIQHSNAIRKRYMC